jgi:oxidoreductase
VSGRGRTPVRVAIVGLGWAGRSIWLPRLRAHPDFAVTAVVDPDPRVRALAVEGQAGVLAFAGIDELDFGQADLAVVAVPNHLHTVIACRLLRDGLAVFLEKPVCLNSVEAAHLAAAERAGGAVLLAGSAARYRRDVRSLHSLAESLGEIRHVDLAWVRASGVPNAGGWFTRRHLAGGGALVDLGWHLLDTVGPLLGTGDFDQVVGTTSSDFVNNGSARAAWRHDLPSGDGFLDGGDVEDTARGFLVTQEGISVSLRASWASHEAYDRTVITVEGSTGTASLRCTFGFSPNRRGGSELTHTRGGVCVPVPVPEDVIGAEYDRQLDDLPAQIADPASRGRAVEEVQRTVGVIERLYDSARLARAFRQPVVAVSGDR